jgi:hypothetical protein
MRNRKNEAHLDSMADGMSEIQDRSQIRFLTAKQEQQRIRHRARKQHNRAKTNFFILFDDIGFDFDALMHNSSCARGRRRVNKKKKVKKQEAKQR